MYKLVVSDLDGTLLNKEHMLEDESVTVLQKLIDNGIDVVLATGRAYIDAKRIRDIFNREIPIITSNGAAVYDEKDNLISSHIIKEEVLDFAYNLDYSIFGDEIALSSVTPENWYIHSEISAENRLNDYSDDEWFYEPLDRKDVDKTKINKLFIVAKHESLLKIKEVFDKKFGEYVNVVFSLEDCLEIFDKNATKANGLKELAKIKGYDLSSSVSFGDGFNDVELLKLTTKSYIMKNSSDRLKKELNNIEVIGSNENLSVAKKLEEIYGYRSI